MPPSMSGVRKGLGGGGGGLDCWFQLGEGMRLVVTRQCKEEREETNERGPMGRNCMSMLALSPWLRSRKNRTFDGGGVDEGKFESKCKGKY